MKRTSSKHVVWLAVIVAASTLAFYGCPADPGSGNNNNGAMGGCYWGNPSFPTGGRLSGNLLGTVTPGAVDADHLDLAPQNVALAVNATARSAVVSNRCECSRSSRVSSSSGSSSAVSAAGASALSTGSGLSTEDLAAAQQHERRGARPGGRRWRHERGSPIDLAIAAPCAGAGARGDGIT